MLFVGRFDKVKLRWLPTVSFCEQESGEASSARWVRNMPSASTVHFCKRKTCPPAERLLAYHTGTLASEEECETLHHLAQCDFCDAEIALLAKCPPATDEVCNKNVEMPASLILLAKALLQDKARRAGGCTERLCERLTLTDA